MSTSSPRAASTPPPACGRQAGDHPSETGMSIRGLSALLAVIVSCAMPHGLPAETLKIASPIRGSWEGAIPELGKQAGIFRNHGLDLDILYTQGGGETLKVPAPTRRSWGAGIPDLGKQAGIFRKHGLDLDILYTQGGGETLQVVVSGSVDIGLSARVLGRLRAQWKGAAPPL